GGRRPRSDGRGRRRLGGGAVPLWPGGNRRPSLHRWRGHARARGGSRAAGCAGTRGRKGRMMAARTPLIAGNWKMHKSEAQAEEYIQGLLPRVSSVSGVDVAICVPFTDLRAMVDSARGSRVEVYAQNMHQEPEGAFTGEVSAPMLCELDVNGVVLGHSERRELFGETDRALALKVPAALAAGLAPVLCVGETEAERDEGETERKLRHQIGEDLAGISDEQLAGVTIAYEPIWAIGTGRVATPEQAQEAIAFVRALVGGRSAEVAERVRILYGGSVKPENAAELLALPDVDGGLVGGGRAVRVPRGARRLGTCRAWSRQCRLPRPDARVRQAVGYLPAHHAHSVRDSGGIARRADGQLRGRTPQPRCGRGRQAGPHPHRRGDRRRLARTQSGLAGDFCRQRLSRRCRRWP